jgi:hypothetical protein
MIGIEAHLLAAILRRASLRQPVTCVEGRVLANSVIQGTEAQVRLMDWKNNNLKNGPNDDMSSGLTVREMIGAGWKFLQTCIMEYIKYCLKQGWRKSYIMRCGETWTITL